MKKLLFASLMIGMVAVSCSKDDDNPAPGADPYMSMTAGNAWTYDEIDSTQSPATVRTYTTTSTNVDTTINAKLYHIFTNFDGTTTDSGYYNISGSDYFQLAAFPDPINVVENLYLKDNATVGTSWTGLTKVINAGTINITMSLISTIQEKGISRVVNGITYNNVIHVTSTLSMAPAIPGFDLTSELHSYYAPKYGLIESVTKVNSTAAAIGIYTKTILKTKNF